MKYRGGVAGVALLLSLALAGWWWHQAPTPSGPARVAPDAGERFDGGASSAPVEEAPLSTEELLPLPTPEVLVEAPGDTETGRLLEPDAPETVRVLAEHRHFDVLFVLASIDRSALPAADSATAEVEDDEVEDDEVEDDEVEDDEEEEAENWQDEDPCAADEDNTDAYCECIRNTETTPDRGWRAALDTPVVQMELVRIRERNGTRTIERRLTLTHPVLPVAELPNFPPDPATEGPSLRVSDLDHDGRPEVTVLVSVVSPDCDSFQEDSGTLAVIVDGEDLHVQAVFARSHVSFGGDIDMNSASEETVWRATADAELVVTQTGSSSEGEADGEESTHRERHRQTCGYDTASDAWQCPDEDLARAWLGSVTPFR